MPNLVQLHRWLETHWVAPAYGGGVLLGLTVAFLGAATNTMSGWLYVISGVTLALLMVAALLPPRSLRGLHITRSPIRPTTVGDPLHVTLTIHNTTGQGRALIQLQDQCPAGLGASPQTAIAALPAHGDYRWRYHFTAQQRGIYHWDGVSLRTAAPVGLFWCQRQAKVPGQVTVYPRVWPLRHCPILDQFSVAAGLRWQRSRQADQATEGLTRALRPYRWGDPSRLIHWRTSARYGELRIRELEQLTADNQVLLALDIQAPWSEADFEDAVSAAASLYQYGLQRRLTVALWMASTGILADPRQVLTALAAVQPTPHQPSPPLPRRAVLWLSSQGQPHLPANSAWLAWGLGMSPRAPAHQPVLAMGGDRALSEQLQEEPRQADFSGHPPH
jgi:uncharacterized protein (DUF58 family)